MKRPDTYTDQHQRLVWREAYNAALIGIMSDERRAWAAQKANEALEDYIVRWPLP